jgi:predicted MFS family arabinose efflux permease
VNAFRNPRPEELYARRWQIWGVAMIGLFMALIDITIVNITIPQLQRDLDSPVDTVSWVLNAYNIMFAVLLVAMGRLADQFGRRRFFLLGMSVFTVGSLLCALSWSIDALIAFRVVQAVGAGILAPLALALTTLVFPPAQRGLGLALMAVVANAAAALGPPIGGVLVEFASWPWDAGWHWIFLINVPIEADDRGWGSPLIVSLFVASALLAVAFAMSQRLGRYPMLTPRLVRNIQFVGASVTLFLFAIGMMGTLFMTVIAFVNLWGYSELEAALAVSPIPAMGLIVAPLVGRLSGRVPPRVVAVPALLSMAAGLLLLSEFPAEPSYGSVLGPLVLMGAGVGATFPAVSIGSMGSIRGQELGLGSGIVNMSRQVGFAVGVALLVAVFSGSVDDEIMIARQQVAALTRDSDLTSTERSRVTERALADPSDPETSVVEPATGIERRADRIVDEHVRDSFGTAFRVAAFVTLLAIPFSLTMRRLPTGVAAAEAVPAGG